MKTNVRPTSLKAYDYIRYEAKPPLNERYCLILDFYREKGYPMTDQEVSKGLYRKFNDPYFYDPNSVRPRRNELVEMGLVEEVFETTCTFSKRPATAWFLTGRKIPLNRKSKKKKAKSVPSPNRRSEDQMLYEEAVAR